MVAMERMIRREIGGKRRQLSEYIDAYVSLGMLAGVCMCVCVCVCVYVFEGGVCVLACWMRVCTWDNTHVCALST
jgi:hypothetical protein